MSAGQSLSIVEYFAEHSGYKCGYCGTEDTNYSHGMWAHTLTTRDYQDLIDRGWRRSGQYCYKPTMERTCCPLYTIKCDAPSFKPSKSQKKVVKKFVNYILHDKKPSGYDKDDSEAEMKPAPGGNEDTEEIEKKVHLKDVDGIFSQEKESKVDVKLKSEEKICEAEGSSVQSRDMKPSKSVATVSQPAGKDPEKPVQGKAKMRRLEKWRAKHPGDAVVSMEDKNKEKSIEDLLKPLETEKAKAQHKWEVKLVRADSEDPEFNSSMAETVKLYQKYQRIIHNDSPDKCTEKQFQRFLCNSPLRSAGVEGSYHYQYCLDDKIVAVGVLDVLPVCVSSVYLFYDPDYSFLSLGTLTSLLEISLVRQLSSAHPAITNYYLGFYIHTCVKMRYKGRYSPSYLLCPQTYRWQPIEASKILLDKSSYSRLDPDPSNTDRETVAASSLGEVGVLCSRQAVNYRIFQMLLEQDDQEEERDREEVLEYAGLVGNTVSKRMLLYRVI